MIFTSSDAKIGLIIEDDTISKILHEFKMAFPLETGGVLIGTICSNRNLAIISNVLPAPSDSVHKPFLFLRGERGLSKQIQSQFPLYYLGEWHSHPNGLPEPSSIDIKQMQSNAIEAHYGAKSPILLIVGENPESPKFQAFIHSPSKEFIRLIAEI